MLPTYHTPPTPLHSTRSLQGALILHDRCSGCVAMNVLWSLNYILFFKYVHCRPFVVAASGRITTPPPPPPHIELPIYIITFILYTPYIYRIYREVIDYTYIVSLV